jgi:hypothetical protein
MTTRASPLAYGACSQLRASMTTNSDYWREERRGSACPRCWTLFAAPHCLTPFEGQAIETSPVAVFALYSDPLCVGRVPHARAGNAAPHHLSPDWVTINERTGGQAPPVRSRGLPSRTRSRHRLHARLRASFPRAEPGTVQIASSGPVPISLVGATRRER